jgi:(S)-2-hydroxy-acid oxidase
MVEAIPVCLDDFEAVARQRLPKQVYDYYRSGADDELSLKRNVQAFRSLIIRPRVLIDVAQRDTVVRPLGGSAKLSFPVGIASTASQRMAHPDGELATARAAAAAGTIMIVSTIATTSLEDIAKAAPNGQRWFQLYVYKDRAVTMDLVRRAEKADYKALVLTVDTPYAGKRRNDLRNAFTLPLHLKMANFPNNDEKADSVKARGKGTSGFSEYVGKLLSPSLTWDDVDWLRTVTRLPLLVKGILTAEDALEACKRGVNGIIVSNHGARQLDSVPATIEALPEIVEAVRGRCDVFLDGGVRTGGDVFKALALGAKAVFIGRPVLWGLAYEGETGASKVLEIMREEFSLAMALAGCRSVEEIVRMKRCVVHEDHYRRYLSKL